MKVFNEQQKFNHPLMILGLGAAFIVFIGLVIKDWEQISQMNTTNMLLSLSGLFVLLIISFFFFLLKLYTRIDEKGINYQFYPFQLSLQVISWKEIETCYLRKYKAILEFGGWGYRINLTRQNGRAYTTTGNIGLQLKLKNGKKILIGTQKKEELQRTLDTYKDKFSQH